MHHLNLLLLFTGGLRPRSFRFVLLCCLLFVVCCCVVVVVLCAVGGGGGGGASRAGRSKEGQEGESSSTLLSTRVPLQKKYELS